MLKSVDTLDTPGCSSNSLLGAILSNAQIAQQQQQLTEVRTQMSTQDLVAEEMCRYRLSAVAKEEPLKFWKSHESDFPMLAISARSLLSIQSTNCSSERANSTAGLILTDKWL